MMRRGLIMFLALMLCMTASAEPFVENGIAWSSTPEEVMEILGPDAQCVEQGSDGLGTVTTVGTEEGQFASLPCTCVRAMFWNGALTMVGYFFEESDLPEVQALLDAAVALYGEPNVQADDAVSLEEYVEGAKTLAQWNPDEETVITLSEYTGEGLIQQDYPYLYWIAFQNIPVSIALDEAMDAWMEAKGASGQ